MVPYGVTTGPQQQAKEEARHHDDPDVRQGFSFRDGAEASVTVTAMTAASPTFIPTATGASTEVHNSERVDISPASKKKSSKRGKKTADAAEKVTRGSEVDCLWGRGRVVEERQQHVVVRLTSWALHCSPAQHPAEHTVVCYLNISDVHAVTPPTKLKDMTLLESLVYIHDRKQMGAQWVSSKKEFPAYLGASSSNMDLDKSVSSVLGLRSRSTSFGGTIDTKVDEETRNQNALKCYEQAINACEVLQQKSASGSAKEVRAQILLTEIECTNRAAACALKLDLFPKVVTHSTNALRLLRTLESQRKNHPPKSKDADPLLKCGEIKVFGVWRVKALLMTAHAIWSAGHTMPTPVILKAGLILDKYTKGTDPNTGLPLPWDSNSSMSGSKSPSKRKTSSKSGSKAVLFSPEFARRVRKLWQYKNRLDRLVSSMEVVSAAREVVGDPTNDPTTAQKIEKCESTTTSISHYPSVAPSGSIDDQSILSASTTTTTSLISSAVATTCSASTAPHKNRTMGSVKVNKEVANSRQPVSETPTDDADQVVEEQSSTISCFIPPSISRDEFSHDSVTGESVLSSSPGTASTVTTIDETTVDSSDEVSSVHDSSEPRYMEVKTMTPLLPTSSVDLTEEGELDELAPEIESACRADAIPGLLPTRSRGFPFQTSTSSSHDRPASPDLPSQILNVDQKSSPSRPQQVLNIGQDSKNKSVDKPSTFAESYLSGNFYQNIYDLERKSGSNLRRSGDSVSSAPAELMSTPPRVSAELPSLAAHVVTPPSPDDYAREDNRPLSARISPGLSSASRLPIRAKVKNYKATSPSRRKKWPYDESSNFNGVDESEENGDQDSDDEEDAWRSQLKPFVPHLRRYAESETTCSASAFKDDDSSCLQDTDHLGLPARRKRQVSFSEELVCVYPHPNRHDQEFYSDSSDDEDCGGFAQRRHQRTWYSKPEFLTGLVVVAASGAGLIFLTKKLFSLRK